MSRTFGYSTNIEFGNTSQTATLPAHY